MIIVNEGKTISSMKLQLAGIMSTDNFENVSKNFAGLNSILADTGCKFKKPHLIPLFLPFLALPSIRILCTGLVDVKARSILKTIAT
jgi:adenine deaminase